MKNYEIYQHAEALVKVFNNLSQPLPVKVNFYLQKNRAKLVELAQEIDQARLNIAASFGTLDEKTQQYVIPSENLQAANDEVNDLFNLDQDVKIYKVSLDSFKDDFVLTIEQMEAIMFMIEG